jgi:AcrR family transcriptional regulator
MIRKQKGKTGARVRLDVPWSVGDIRTIVRTSPGAFMAAVPTNSSLPPIRREGTRERTRQKADSLLKAAAALIAEKGFEATSLREVGRLFEVILGGMYYYFESKDDLLFQIQQRTFESLLEAQERSLTEPGTAVERLRRVLVGHLAFFERHPNEMKICTYELESLKGERYDRVLAVRRRYFRLVADIVAELLGGKPKAKEARSRHLTLFIFGMLNWAFMWYRGSRDGSVESLGEEMLDLVLNGISTKRAAR